MLHVVRFKSSELDALVTAINATGYGLTFGLHTRLDATIDRVTRSVAAGNLYVNRNIIGAVVGVQPFGGRGLSGTGPKAGGPLYLSRLVAPGSWSGGNPGGPGDPAARDLAAWRGGSAIPATRLGQETELPGPVGERNLYALHPRGRVAVSADSEDAFWKQISAVLATGNKAVVTAGNPVTTCPADLPPQVAARIEWLRDDLGTAPALAAALVEGDGARIAAASEILAGRDGAIVTLQAPSECGGYVLDWLLEEVSTSINTTAAGGNASLMALS